MAPAVELCSVIPASGRTQENHGGPRRAASALLRRGVLYLRPALQRTAGFETEGGTLVPEHARTSLGHSRKLLTRVLTALCSTLALRYWHLLVRLSSLANTYKSRVFIHHLFWCQLSKFGHTQKPFFPPSARSELCSCLIILPAT